jgi:hypothetical protein
MTSPLRSTTCGHDHPEHNGPGKSELVQAILAMSMKASDSLLAAEEPELVEKTLRRNVGIGASVASDR